MRTKDEILDNARHDITDEQYKTTKANWLEVRKIEVLIDIRDVLRTNLFRIAELYSAFIEKD